MALSFTPAGKTYVASQNHLGAESIAVATVSRDEPVSTGAAATAGDEPGRIMALVLMGGLLVWGVFTYATWDKVMANAKQGTAEEQVLALNNAWAEAEVWHDQAAMDRILHEGFVLTDEDGGRMTKAALLEASRALSLRSQTLNADSILIEGGRAVVQGTGLMLVRSADEEEQRRFRYTSVYMQFDGAWRAVEQRLARAA